MQYITFNDLACRNFQYEEGKTYKLLKKKDMIIGKLYNITEFEINCYENPLDCLTFSPLIDGDCNINQICEVKPLGKVETRKALHGNVSVANKIKIGAKLDLMHFFKNGFKKNTKNKNIIVTNKNSTTRAIKKEWNTMVFNGEENEIATAGNVNRIVLNGWSSQVSTSGRSTRIIINSNCNAVATSGLFTQIAISGQQNQIVASGDCSLIANNGKSNKIATTGSYNRVATTDKNSVIANIGKDGKAKGVKGTWITLAEYKYDDKIYTSVPVCVKTFRVDGKKIKENTFYMLQNKKLVEVKNEEE